MPFTCAVSRNPAGWLDIQIQSNCGVIHKAGIYSGYTGTRLPSGLSEQTASQYQVLFDSWDDMYIHRHVSACEQGVISLVEPAIKAISKVEGDVMKQITQWRIETYAQVTDSSVKQAKVTGLTSSGSEIPLWCSGPVNTKGTTGLYGEQGQSTGMETSGFYRHSRLDLPSDLLSRFQIYHPVIIGEDLRG
jgi:hypothetical protein